LIPLVLLYPFVVWNQFESHWLLNDALNFAISISLKFKDKINFAPFDNLMEQNANVIFELKCLASKTKNEHFGVLDSFIYFLRKHGKKNLII